MSNLLSILILNRNDSNSVINLINDLKEQTFQDFHIIIIDDNSTQAENDKLYNINDNRIHVYSYPSPWKFGNDNKWDLGLRKTYEKGSKYTYTIQTDMIINDINLLEKLVQYMEENSGCGASCPTIYDAKGVMTWGPGIEKERMGKKYNINESFITRNSVMHEMSYINNKLIYYGHEFYFNNCMKLLGYYTTPIEGVSVTHFGGGTSNKTIFKKDYYRPRTTILLLKLFNKDDSLKTKCKILYQECSEPINRMKKFLINLNVKDFLKSFTMFFFGILAGLLIHVELSLKEKDLG